MSANYQSMNYVSVHQSGEGQLSVNILADILADSWLRVDRYVRRKVSKLQNIWKVEFVKRIKQESMLTIH